MLDRKDKTHFLEIDILRSLAIIFIVIYHLIMFLGDDNSINNIIQAILLYTSYLGLGLFFFISGFILNSKYQNIAYFMDAIKFYWRRLLRIYPLYLMGLGLAIFIWGFLKIGYFSANFNAYDIIANVLNLQEVFISIIKIPNVWFVSAILIFYLIFSLSMSISKNTPYLFLVLFIFFILLIVMHRFFNLFEERIFIYYNIFVFGILFNRFRFFPTRNSILTASNSITLAIILFISTSIVFIMWIIRSTYPISISINLSQYIHSSLLFNSFSFFSNLIFSDPNLRYLDIDIMLISFCLISYPIAYHLSSIVPEKRLGFILRISKGSYVAFLIHLPIIVIMMEILSRYHFSEYYSIFYTFIIGLPVIFTIAYYIQLFELKSLCNKKLMLSISIIFLLLYIILNPLSVSSTQTKDIGNNLGTGWHELENWDGVSARWMQNNSTIFLYSINNSFSRISFQVLSFQKPRTLEIYTNDILVNRTVVPGNLTSIALTIPLKKGTNLVRFYSPDRCEKPCDMKDLKSDDCRCLGLAFQQIHTT